MEQIDRLVGQILKRLWNSWKSTGIDSVLVVTSDHSTPVCFGDHSNEPVPITIAFLEKIVSLKSPIPLICCFLGGCDWSGFNPEHQ